MEKNESTCVVVQLAELYWADRDSRRFISWLDQYHGLGAADKMRISSAINSAARRISTDLYYAVEQRLLLEIS